MIPREKDDEVFWKDPVVAEVRKVREAMFGERALHWGDERQRSGRMPDLLMADQGNKEGNRVEEFDGDFH